MNVLTVAGFHRSGTSLLTQLLHRAGLFVGDDLISEDTTNPYGHFEDWEFVRLHKALLADNGFTWQVDRPLLPYIAPDRWAHMAHLVERRGLSHTLWGFKDPRSCFFLPAWKHLIPDLKTIVIYRHWADSAYSLERRHASHLLERKGPVALHRRFWERPDHALLMWVEQNRALVRYARAYPDDTLVVAVSALEQGLPIIDLVNAAWDLGLEALPTSETFDPNALGRRPGRQPVSRTETVAALEKTWHDLDTLAELTQRRVQETAHGAWSDTTSRSGVSAVGHRHTADGERAARVRERVPEEPRR